MAAKKKTRHKAHSQSHPGTFLTRSLLVAGGLLVVAVVIWLLVTTTPPAGFPRSIGVDEAYTMYQDGTFFLDVREDSEWNEFHIPGTTHIPLNDLSARVDELPKDRPIVVVCRSGNRSKQGRDILLKVGFTEVTSMDGGLKAWQANGYPIEP
jgi:rhodanese-related sulfurtransferase